MPPILERIHKGHQGIVKCREQAKNINLVAWCELRYRLLVNIISVLNSEPTKLSG